jgi:hypothetical protein
MKILNPLRFFRGMATSEAKLQPPDPDKKLKKSISIAEVVDLLCEGPIEGIVDPFGKKVYGLDMLKGIYLNGVPVMNANGEYNYRSIMVEVNFGTEKQKSLPSFKNAYITKPAGFKLLGPITTQDDIKSDGRNFTSWARSSDGWPSTPQDPFIFTYQIRNRDVKRLRVNFLIEALSDTVDSGKTAGTAKESTLNLRLMWGLDGDPNIQIKDVNFHGLVQSPYAYTIGDGTIEDAEREGSAYYINTNYNPASMVGGIGSRAPGAAIDFGTDDIYKNIPVITP